MNHTVQVAPTGHSTAHSEQKIGGKKPLLMARPSFKLFIAEL